MTDANKIDLEVASAANTEIIRAKLKTIQMLGLEDEIEDIVISLTSQYHLLRVLKENPTTFIYVALGRRQSNLALARMAMKLMEQILRL